MPEGVATEAPPAPAAAKVESPRRRAPVKTAPVRVELLDGSSMELDVDRKIRGHELLERVCDKLNLVEKDYFGLMHMDRGEGRVWLDLEKRVSKFFVRNEQWQVAFAIKFYPPEPAQLQEELTRYQLVLAVRKDLLDGRLPCSTVTHALLASYLLQSELGDYEEAERSAGHCRQLRLAPAAACTPELEEKAVELHKTHRYPLQSELGDYEEAERSAGHCRELRLAPAAACTPELEKKAVELHKTHRYPLQSELGDYEEAERSAGHCRQLRLAPAAACTPELEEKAVELHKTHRGQTPAEAELNYLENAKKLAMYGVELHAARDSQGVEITLGVCSSGLLVHREKLRINRFAWPKILKISYKRHNFYVKLRPGEFDQYESTVGFKLANHRAAKKLWKTCVEHHTFFRLMSPEPAKSSTLFPRLGSRFRYSGRTHYQSRAAPVQRAPPNFARTLSARKLSSRSMDALAQPVKEEPLPPELAKRHTMPPQPAPRPATAAVKDKKLPAGAVRVMPTAPPQEKREKEKELKERELKEREAKREPAQRAGRPSENGSEVNGEQPSDAANNVDTTPKKSKTGAFALFGGKKDKSPKEKEEKSPKQKSPKEKSPKENSPKGKDKKAKDQKTKVAVLDTSNDSSNLDSSREKSPAKDKSPTKSEKSPDKPGYTKPYDYTETDPEKSPTRKPFIQGAFSYEKEPQADGKQRSPDDSQSPSTRRATGLAFNYAPGEDHKVAESAEKRKTSPVDPADHRLVTPGIDYVQSAALKEQAKQASVDSAALLNAERAHHMDPALKAAVAPVVAAAAPVGKEVQVVIITAKYNPKSKKLDEANGTVHVVKGTVNPTTGKIQTDSELIDPKSGQVQYTDPSTGKQEVKNGHVDNKTGNIIFSTAVVDPKTGKLDPTLGQQYTVVNQSADKVESKPGREVQLVVITSKYDGKHKKLDALHGHFDVSKAIVGPDGKVYSNYGVIDPKAGKIDYTDPKTGKQEPKQAYIDQKTGNLLVTTGVIDPKSGKVDSSLGQQFSIVDKDASKANREVRLVVVTGKYDLKNKKIDPTHAYVDAVKGILSGTDGKIYTDYGIIEPRTGDILYTDSKTGKQEIKQAKVDPKTGNILLLSGVVDPRTGQLDTALGQQYSIVDKPIDSFGSVPGKEVQLVAITSKYDNKTKKLDNPNGHIETSRAIVADADGTVHTNFGVLDPKTGKVHFTDPKTGKPDSKQALVDPRTGSFLLTAGVVDPKTGKTDSSLAQQLTIVDKDAPKGIPERHVNLVIVTTKYDQKTKKLDPANAHIISVPGVAGTDDKIRTLFGVVDPSTGEITITDRITGKQDVKRAQIDPKTGNLILTSGVVDPKTGQVDPSLGQQISIVDKVDDTFGIVPGKEVQFVIITSKYDPKHKQLDSINGHVETLRGILSSADGKVHTNFGILDPKTGKLQYTDPKTGKQEIKQAVADPKTGNFFLTTGVVDPKTGKVDNSLAQQLCIVDKDEKPKQREINLVIVTTKYDPKTKKLDPANAHIISVPGVAGTDDKIRTLFGVVDPSTGEITITDRITGKQDVKRAQIDPKTGNLILTSGVVDPKTGQVDPSLGQQISIVDKVDDTFGIVPGKEVQFVIITSKYDPKHKQLDSINGHVETLRGILSSADGKVHTNFGILDPKTGKLQYTDPKTGKQEIKQAVADPKTGNFFLTTGVVDPKTGKVDNSLAQQLCIVDKDEKPKQREINLVIVTTKYDPKTKKLDPANAHITSVPGLVGTDDKIRSLFGVVDPRTGEIIITDPVTGKQDVKRAQIDPKTGNLILTSGVVDPKTGQVDPLLGQQISIVDKVDDTFGIVPGKEVQFVIITSKYDPKNKQLDSTNGHVETSRGILNSSDGKVHTNFGILDPKTGKLQYTDPKTGKQEIKQAVADPKTGNFILTTGVVDPKTGKVDNALAQQLCIVDKDEKPKQREIHLVIITTKYDHKTKKRDPNNPQIDTVSGTIGPDGKVRTAVGVVDPATGEITVTDPKTGKQEVKHAHRDPSTGHLLITSQVVDPKTGKVDPTLAQQYSIVDKQVVPVKVPAAIGEIQLVIITGKLDPKNNNIDPATGKIDASRAYVSSEDGKIHTDFGIIDPKSGQILYKDPVTGKQELKQANIDPKTGNYLITAGVVDPKTGKVDPYYAQQVSIVDKQNVLSKVGSPVVSRLTASPVPSPVVPPSPVRTPVATPIQSPVQKTSPTSVSPPVQTQRSSALVSPGVPPPEPPKRKIVKIMVIFTRLDPKTKKPDLHSAEVEHLTGILEPNGLIETKYGVIDSNKGNIVITDPATGQKQTKDGLVMQETRQVFINSGAIDPKTGKLDPNLGMIFSVAKQDDPVVEITTITGYVDSKTGKVNIADGLIEHTKGKVDAETGHISTKHGVIDPSNGVIFVTDTSGVQDTKPIKVDENTGQVTIIGCVDPKTGKVDPNLGQVIVVGTHIDPVVEVTTFVGKVDSKKGLIEPKNSVVESTTGQLNPENNKIDTKYGQIDLIKGTVTYNDPKTGKLESKEVKVDPITGQLLLRSGQVNPKSGKPDKDIGRLISLRIIQNKVDPVSGKQIVKNEPKNVKVDPKTNQIWTAGPKDPATGETLYTTGQIDPRTGYIITIYGRIDPKTGNIVRTTDIDKSLVKVDPVSGQIYTATGETDENNQPLYSASQVDPSTGEIYTKLGRIDPQTGRLIIIKIFVITQKDDNGKIKEVDPKECTIDETTGRIVTTKTVYVYQIVDPITGETIEVDPDDPRLKGARTTVTQTMTLSGKIDPVTGRIKTEYGDIDPDTGDIDPSTAVRDPVTGQLILHYSQIDPSHFNDKSCNYSIEKETQDLPANIDIQTVNTTKFSTFGKDESPGRGDEPKTFTEYTTSEHIKHQGIVSSTTPISSKIPVSQRSKAVKTPTPPAAPVVVKTTTKQLLTKNEDGVTHNVEQEVENLGTGEVTFSTQTNKAESLEPALESGGKSPYVTARAVTTRTATTHEDLGTNARTQQLEEKTVAHTLTSSATRQEQRVVTQQVKTTVTTGDQLARRGSESSVSSGDSGTPIDFDEGSGEGHYYTEPGAYTTTTSSTVVSNAPFGSMIGAAAAHIGETHGAGAGAGTGAATPEGEGATEGEIVSSQTISSKTRTVETITYKTERDGVVETRVEQKITIQSDGDPIDHDRALAEAIQEATAMNPDMTVEKIEIQQQSTQN